MAKFVTIGDHEMINAEQIVGIGLSIPENTENLQINGRVSLTISLTNNVCVTISDYRTIKEFFRDLRYHFYEGMQPDTYDEMYRKFLEITNEENER